MLPISVIIPTFRAGEILTQAITSVLQQTRWPEEVIVVDDASGDDTAELVRSMQQRLPSGWLKLIELPANRGAGEARNVGWNAAQGVCVAFLDADDQWHPRKLELQWEYFDARPELALCGHAFRFPWDKEELHKDCRQVKGRSVSAGEMLWRNPFVTPSVMVRRELPFRFKAGKRYMEDHLLWMEIAFSGHKVCKLEEKLAIIGKHQFGAGGLSAKLWSMEMSELDNYWILHRNHRIGMVTALFFSFLSLLKFSRRLLVVGFRRSVGALKGAR